MVLVWFINLLTAEHLFCCVLLLLFLCVCVFYGLPHSYKKSKHFLSSYMIPYNPPENQIIYIFSHETKFSKAAVLVSLSFSQGWSWEKTALIKNKTVKLKGLINQSWQVWLPMSLACLYEDECFDLSKAQDLNFRFTTTTISNFMSVCTPIPWMCVSVCDMGVGVGGGQGLTDLNMSH